MIDLHDVRYFTIGLNEDQRKDATAKVISISLKNRNQIINLCI